MRDDYTYLIELIDEQGLVVGQTPFAPDWEPAIEWARFAGLRAGAAWTMGPTPELVVEPVWDTEHGEPHVGGVRTELRAPARDPWTSEISTAYFAEAARTLKAQLITAGTLAAECHVGFRTTAFSRPPAAPLPSGWFTAVDADPPIDVCDAPLDRLIDASDEQGVAHDEDVPAFVASDVVEEAVQLTRAADERETGGILIGRLHRDTTGRDLFVEVTAQIPARHTVGDSVKLTFTSDTWTDARAALALRRRNEIMCGWWHSHPAFAWCRECPPERQRVCRLGKGFLSPEDRALHRAIFPRAFTLALLMTHTATGIDAALFGWRGGVIEPRGFRLLQGATHHASTHAS